MARARCVKISASTLPVPVGYTISVTFKHESESRGIAIGPVVVTDHEVFDEWRRKCGITGPGIPYGSTPEGVHRLGWLSKPDAIKVADHYGVTLGES